MSLTRFIAQRWIDWAVLALINIAGAILFALVASGAPALPVADTNDAPSVTLAWNPMNNPLVAGDYVYFGGKSGVYTNVSKVPNWFSQLSIYDLQAGYRYYFAASTYSDAGAESALSSEAVWVFYAYKQTNQIFQIWQMTNRLMNVNNPAWPLMFFRMSNGWLQASSKLPPFASWNDIAHFNFTNGSPLFETNIYQYQRTP